MHIYEFGDKNKPIILLLPGTMCYYKANFEKVINELSKDFLVAIVSYTGFDENDKEIYTSLIDEVNKIEEYIIKNYNGEILTAYGCSLGGSFVSHLLSRNKIHIKYGIIGSSDLDQTNKFKANLLSSLIVKVTFNYIHTGTYKSNFMKKRYKKEMDANDPYNKAFVSLIGRDKYDLSFIKKESIKNQYKSDLITKLPKDIENKNGEIHVFYAQKMGKKYLKRYKKYFKKPIIHTFDLRHEELLGVYPEKWCSLIKEISFKNKII